MLRRLLSCALLSTMLWGCQKTNPHPLDPFEGINREIYGLNKTIDKAIVKPVAYLYWQYMPSPFQTGIGNFYDNLREIPNVANDILQGKFAYASHDFSRFLINSTLGIGGFFDPAGSLGLPHRKEDFGQTLYVWGYEESAYIVLPILGPSTIRDTVGLAVDYYAFSVWPWIDSDELRYGLLTLDLIDLRARLLRHDTVISTVAVDEYAFMRDAYFQRRLYLINNELDNDANANGIADDDPYDAGTTADAALLEAPKQQTPAAVEKETAKETTKQAEKPVTEADNKTVKAATTATVATTTTSDKNKKVTATKEEVKEVKAVKTDGTSTSHTGSSIKTSTSKTSH